MIKIRIGFTLFLIVSYVNAGFITSVSKEITKLIKPRRTRSEKSLPLLKVPEKDENAKSGEEFDIALATERLGFVYCDIKQEPFMGKFVKEYLKISQGHYVILQTLDPRKVVPSETRDLIVACRNFLQDEVLWDNGLRLAEVDKDIKQVQAVERIIQFDYFAAKPYKFVALQCPIKMDNQLATNVKTIFFSALGKTKDENKMDDEEKTDDEKKKNKDGIGRPYYVFADYTQRDKSKFKILMRTVVQDFNRAFADGSPPRPEKIKSRIYDNPQRCPIRLHIKPERFNDGFRLFGKDAEAAFLTEKLRFFNESYQPNKIYRFLDTLMEMKKGYEILSYYEWLSTITRDLSEDLSIFETAVPFDCPKYIQGAKSLQKYGPVQPADDTSNIKFISPVRVNIRLKITETSLVRFFFPCPVTFTSEEHSGEATVNVLPIIYKSSVKCKEHAFYYIIMNKDTSEEYSDFFFSRVNELQEGVNVSEAGGIVEIAFGNEPAAVNEPVSVDKPVEGVEPDAGIKPVGGSVSIKAFEGQKPDEDVNPVRGSDPVGGVEFARHAEAVKDVEPRKSEELSGSIRGPYSNDGGNDADISDVSGSIGVSGEMPQQTSN